MSSSASSAGFGLLSAASWGGADFVGGMGSRRAPALLVVVSGDSVSLLVLLVICWMMRLALPAPHDLLCAALAGAVGALALTVFYRALSMGAMGLTAALTGLLTALIPVLYSIAQDGLPSMLTVIGLATGCAAIWLITRTPSSEGAGTPPKALLMGAVAGLGFGMQLILFKMASGGGVLWAMTTSRAAAVAALLVFLVAMPPKGPWRGFWLTGIAAATLDTLGTLLYMRTALLGRLVVAAVICSLYPAGTILLAALVLREWPTLRQMAGMALALGAVVLLSV
ncbi:MAG: DMT family transporter [Terracidiphilus sp.]|nr:DMT family transporter [Terracidiphilus sp.]